MKKKIILFFLFVCSFLIFADQSDELVNAVKAGNLTRVKLLVENGVDVNAFDSNEYSPLYYAIEHNQLEITEYLLIHGADPNRDYTITLGPGQSVPPMRIALNNNNQEMIDLLLKHGASQSVVRDYYSNEMYASISEGNLVWAELLILHEKASLLDDTLLTLIEYESASYEGRQLIEKHGPEGISDGSLNLLETLIPGTVRELISLPFPMATSFLHDDKDPFLYSNSKAFDNSLSTSWVEGVDGPGIGQKIAFIVEPDATVIKIVPGYGEEAYFTSNNRVKSAILRFYELIENASMDPTDCWIRIESIDYAKELDFEDELSFQSFLLDIPSRSDHYGRILAVLEILEVYPGSRWDDTCIAEIRISE